MAYPYRIKAQAMELLALGYNPAETADKLNIGKTTVYAWMKEPEFGESQERCKRSIEDKMTEGVNLALGKLNAILLDDTAETKDQIAAANHLLRGHANLMRATASKRAADSLERAITPEELAEKRQRLIERIQGNVIDGETGKLEVIEDE